LIEKKAALMGRTEPRDLYDFWHLTEYKGMDTEHQPEFDRKAKNKGHDPEAKVLAKEKVLKQCWEKKLENQVHDLPKFDDVFRQARRSFKL
jgi:predicted nucleotidyltransferase component of viral defense system